MNKNVTNLSNIFTESSNPLNYHDVQVTFDDFSLLYGPKWINDTLISFVFEYYRQDIYRKQAEQMCFIPPEIVQMIKLLPISEIKQELQSFNLDSKDLVFFPINDNDTGDQGGGTHWSLLIFSKEKGEKEGVFTHLDSLQSSQISNNLNSAIKVANRLKQSNLLDIRTNRTKNNNNNKSSQSSSSDSSKKSSKSNSITKNSNQNNNNNNITNNRSLRSHDDITVIEDKKFPRQANTYDCGLYVILAVTIRAENFRNPNCGFTTDEINSDTIESLRVQLRKTIEKLYQSQS